MINSNQNTSSRGSKARRLQIIITTIFIIVLCAGEIGGIFLYISEMSFDMVVIVYFIAVNLLILAAFVPFLMNLSDAAKGKINENAKEEEESNVWDDVGGSFWNQRLARNPKRRL